MNDENTRKMYFLNFYKFNISLLLFDLDFRYNLQVKLNICYLKFFFHLKQQYRSGS